MANWLRSVLAVACGVAIWNTVMGEPYAWMVALLLGLTLVAWLLISELRGDA